MLVEHARNLMGIENAVHAEYGLEGTAIVDALACSLVETEITVDLAPGSRLAGIHGEASVVERTNCNYGLNPEFAHIADAKGLRVSARDDTGEVRAIERTDHPFFVGTLYQPQRTTSTRAPHPLLVAFVRAAIA
ncbi:MAG: hypothetical protein AAF480_13000 [Actinomycetota bacterium]